MRYFIAFLLLACAVSAHAQTNIYSSGMCHTSGPPAFNPTARGCRFDLDTVSQTLYLWKVGTTWVAIGEGIDIVSGSIAPVYTPTKWQSNFAINGVDSLYRYYSGAWHHINKGGGGATYTAGTGISISGSNVISNTGDLSPTNELNTGFQVTGSNLVLGDAGGNYNVPVVNIAPIQSGTAADFNQTGSVLSLDYTNGQKASATLPGFLSAVDWGVFNSKLSSSPSLGTGFVNGGGSGTIPDNTLVNTGGGTGFEFDTPLDDDVHFTGFTDNNQSFYGCSFNEAGDNEYRVKGRLWSASNEHRLNYNLSGYGQHINLEDDEFGYGSTYDFNVSGLIISATGETKIPIKYQEDHSSDIIQDDRAVPDVGSVKKLIPSVVQDFYTDASNVNAAQFDDLYFCDFLAGSRVTMPNDGDKLEAFYSGNFNNSSVNVGLTIAFSDEATTGNLTLFSTGSWTCSVSIIRKSSTTARMSVIFNTPTAVVKSFVREVDVTGLSLDSGTQPLILKGGQDGSGTGATGSITAKFGYVKVISAAL